MAFLGYTFAALIYIVFGALWRGYVLFLLWAWFVVPTFGAPTLSIPAAIGVSLIVTYLARDGRPAEKVKKFSEQLASALVRAGLAPLIALGIGSVVRVFM